MRFYVRKRRTTPAVIIVALIDVLIVLVIFLLVTTTFKQQQYVVKLAESSQSQKAGANENLPLEVSIAKDGSLRFGHGPNADPITPEQLLARLQEAVARNPRRHARHQRRRKRAVGQGREGARRRRHCENQDPYRLHEGGKSGNQTVIWRCGRNIRHFLKQGACLA